MNVRRGAMGWMVASTLLATPAWAQDRSSDNAVTQAEDGFGYSVGRETLGIYTSGNARGFSPTAAGNVRIEGLYFDPVFQLSSIVNSSTSIKVGLSAQGYPLIAPSGIVDRALRRPGDRAAASVVLNSDSYGSYGVEIDGSLPLTGKLSLGYGVAGGRVAFADGTDNLNHGEGLIARWRPSAAVEIVPFWSLNNDYGDEAGAFYLPAGKFLPPQPPRHQFDGPSWVGIRYAAANYGVLTRVTPSANWLLRVGVFRSVYDQYRGFTNLLTGVDPAGNADQIVIADPRLTNTSLSGEARLTHSIADGPRLHIVHASLRERDARHQFGGSATVDLGPTRIGERDDPPEPAFAFGPSSHDHVRQATYSLAYDGRWKNIGELSLGGSLVDYRKTTSLPGVAPIVSSSRPFLYSGTLALTVTPRLSAYAGYARGLEESGVSPQNAANRNQPLPAILTSQRDAGLRWLATGSIKAIVGVFDLRKPYFGFVAGNVFSQVGTTRSQGAEFSLSGNLTPRLNLVAGGYFLRPRVEHDPGVIGVIGIRPVGLADHNINVNLNWETPFAQGLALDAAIYARGKMPGTTDNLVTVPPREQVNLGGRYRFKLAARNATFRVQVLNLFDDRGFGVAGSGVYNQQAGRSMAGYLAVDV